MLAFTIQGKPQPKPRPQVTRGNVFFPRSYTLWRGAAGLVARAAIGQRRPAWRPDGSAFAIECRFFLARRDGGDVDNLLGGVMDALNGIAWVDDRRVVEAHASKTLDRVRPRVEVVVRHLEGLAT